MGTTKCGRYLNTAGSAGSMSEFAFIHATEGKFKRREIRKNGKTSYKLRLVSGCHGEKGLRLLQRYKIEFKIVKVYPNGVRVGYVPDHDSSRKRTGSKQSWFPESWSDKDIKRAAEHVAQLKRNRHIKDGDVMFGMYKGVRVGVMKTHGKISTAFPDSIQPKPKKRRK